MPRIRTVKPGLFKNEELAELPMSARLLFVGLFCLADKEGRMEDRPKRIRAELFPYDNIDVNDQLSRLQSAGFIRRYEVGEMKVIQVVNFTRHQRITGSEALTESIYPEQGNTLETTWKQLGRQEGKGKEGKGKEEEADKPPPRQKFVKPDESSLTDYFCEIGLDDFSAQAQAALFLDFYTANGWVVGKSRAPMKDWKASCRTWKHRMNEFKTGKNGSHQQSLNGLSKKPGTSEARIETARNW